MILSVIQEHLVPDLDFPNRHQLRTREIWVKIQEPAVRVAGVIEEIAPIARCVAGGLIPIQLISYPKSVTLGRLGVWSEFSPDNDSDRLSLVEIPRREDPSSVRAAPYLQHLRYSLIQSEADL